MSTADAVVVLAAVAALAGLGWFFFGPRKAVAAVLAGGVQRLEVTVKGGYRPEVIRVRQGVPVELTFDRQESGDCTSRVVFPDFRASATLPASQRTTVRLDPAEAGEFGFACGMNMIHGTVIVDPADGAAPPGRRRGHDDRRQRADRRREVDEAEDHQHQNLRGHGTSRSVRLARALCNPVARGIFPGEDALPAGEASSGALRAVLSARRGEGPGVRIAVKQRGRDDVLDAARFITF